MAAGSCLAGSLLFALLFFALEAGAAGKRGVVNFQMNHEIIIPQWRAYGSSDKNKHPPRAEVIITAEGTKFILDIEKNNDLFAPGYTETHYTKSGISQTVTLNNTDHCFYHGIVRGVEDSSVVLSTCSGLRVFLARFGRLFLEGFAFLRLRAHDLPKIIQVKRDDQQSTKYVELLIVADYAVFQKNKYDLQATKNRLVEVANYLDKFYKSLKIRIALVGLEVWNDRNKCEISADSHATLRSFLSWRRTILKHRKHDNAQLVIGISFNGTTIGLAPLTSMCSSYQSGGVSVDHSENAIGVASTMAHEMGHNFGMSHDTPGCCSARAEAGGCIMAAATGHPFPRVFSWCNKQDLDRFFQSGGGMCLLNMPDTKTLYGGRRCGNGYLEEGEQCDCGEVEECNNPCCNAADCSLKPGAECAHGICCHLCKLRSPGTLCRAKARPCDLPEYCTGKSPFCPENFYQLDGSPCVDGKAYCYSGMCLTYEQQCLQLWGPGARPAPDICFEEVNAAGDMYGNCGKDTNGKYKKCSTSDAKCGKIQCQTSASKPLEHNAVAIDTTITLNGQRILCRGTHVYRNEDEEGDMLDPGLVMAGTKCGDSHVCFEGHCRNTSFFEAGDCGKKCHGHGVCNNIQNCHCFSGWAPPFCERHGNGGSPDSGPIPPKSPLPIIAGVLVAILLLIVIGVAFCYHKWRARLVPLKRMIITPRETQQFSTPPPIENVANGHANPAFKLKTPEKQRKNPSRHGPPQKPLPANPVPANSRAGLPRINTSTAAVPPHGSRSMGQHQTVKRTQPSRVWKQ